ncbi:MAG: GntR family transcriptional regulator [Rhodobacter sp.]|nr:GntR family transcriptional regulator [Rhodobacter sp.]
MPDSAGSAKKQLSERALRELRAWILSGDLPPDQTVSETAAADLIGISRTPTREAMAELVDEGLLERTPTGRWLVRRVTRADIVDAIEFRGVLEGTVVRLAAERGPAAEPLERCREINARLDNVVGSDAATIEFERYAALNEAFHDHLARISGSATMEREVRRAYRLPLAAPSAFLQSQMNIPEVRRSLIVSQRQHNDIIDAVVHREGARAEALAREHARLARTNLDYVIFDNKNLAKKIPGLGVIANESGRRDRGKSHQGRTQ